MAVALSYVRVWKLPQGGSVTAGSMIPIIFVAFRWGPGVGISAGVVFFASYAGNQNVWVYSAIYNGSYLLPELAISSLVMVLLAKAFAARGGLVARG